MHRRIRGPGVRPSLVLIATSLVLAACASAGTVDPATMQVAEASDSAFVAPVLAAVPTWRFLPYEMGPQGGPFKQYEQRIRMPITIAVPPARRRG
jgi:hypothetical protein